MVGRRHGCRDGAGHARSRGRAAGAQPGSTRCLANARDSQGFSGRLAAADHRAAADQRRPERTGAAAIGRPQRPGRIASARGSGSTPWSEERQTRRLGDQRRGLRAIDVASAYFFQSTSAWRRAIPNDVVACDGWPGRWPDPLLPKDTFDLAANTTQPVWLTVAVPKGVPAGDYTGAVRLVAGGKRLWQQPLTVHVWDFSLPDESHVAAKFDVSPGPGENGGKTVGQGPSRDRGHDGPAAALSGQGPAGACVSVRKRPGDGRLYGVRSGRRTLFP